MEDQNEWKARREREKARVRTKLENVAGLIGRVARAQDSIQAARAEERLVEAFMDLMENGPGPDPEQPKQNPPAPEGGTQA